MAKLRVDKIAAPIVKDEFTGSVYFDGTGDYLQMPDSSDFAFGAEDYTIELWIYSRTLSATQRIFGQRASDASELQMMLETNASGELTYYFAISDSSKNIGGVVATQINTWHHIAITRLGGTHTLYVDGVSVATNSTDTGSLNDRAQPFSIGRQGNYTSDNFKGYISNLRICKGHAVYTGNFTVPTRELPVHTAPPKGVVFPAADNRTVLLACQSSTDATADSSGRHTITANGNATAADANPGLFRKTSITSTITENTGSVWFDGTGDYLATEVSNDFALGTNDFTFEMWVYYESRSTGDTPAVLDSTTTTYAPLIGYIENDASTNGHAVVYISANGSSWGIASNKTFGLITAKQWYHLAISRSGSNFYLFKDGQLTDSFTSSSAIHQGANQIGFGRIQSNTYFDGYISNARICNGHAVYTSNFTPPTRELEVHPETVFLGLYDGENIFAEKTGKVIAAYGDRLSSPTPTATDSPIGITTHYPPVTRNVDPVDGPTFQGGAGFVSQNWLTLPKGTTTDRFPNFAGVDAASARGVFGGGSLTPAGSHSDVLDYVTISTLGNAQDFGNLTEEKRNVPASFASSTRGILSGGYVGPAASNVINFVTIASTGNAADFGDLTVARGGMGGLSSSTRGLTCGSADPTSNTIDYVTIQSIGNAVDFGDLNNTARYNQTCSSSTRGIIAGGRTPTTLNVIDYVTIASTGNAQDFGDIQTASDLHSGCSNSTRGLLLTNASSNKQIDFITIASLGNSQTFGDRTVSATYNSACASATRGIFGGGYTPTSINTIDYVTILQTGNAQDFGDLTVARHAGAAFSNGHGGLG